MRLLLPVAAASGANANTPVAVHRCFITGAAPRGLPLRIAGLVKLGLPV
jgi:hypothetical protein